MTLQQLKYIVAIDRHRNFAKAAEAVGISQPTLSGMLQKLEEELDIRIFERSNKSVVPTLSGEKIIRQAERTLAEAERIREIVGEDKDEITGTMPLLIAPTIAPYILPKFIRHYQEGYPEMHLPFLSEKQRENVRRIEGDYLSMRRISLYIREDYIRQRMLNTITRTLQQFMPKGMLEERIVKYGVKL